MSSEGQNEELTFRIRMNRGEKILYDVIPELQGILKLKPVCDRVTIQQSFIAYCVENDIVDLYSQKYIIARC